MSPVASTLLILCAILVTALLVRYFVERMRTNTDQVLNSADFANKTDSQKFASLPMWRKCLFFVVIVVGTALVAAMIYLPGRQRLYTNVCASVGGRYEYYPLEAHHAYDTKQTIVIGCHIPQAVYTKETAQVQSLKEQYRSSLPSLPFYVDAK